MPWFPPQAAVGDRIQLHPASDLWMKGCRYGEVVAVRLGDRGPESYRVLLDATGKAVRVQANQVYEVLDAPIRRDEPVNPPSSQFRGPRGR